MGLSDGLHAAGKDANKVRMVAFWAAVEPEGRQNQCGPKWMWYWYDTGFPRWPLQYSCLENPRGQRSLAGYSPWGHRESDTTEATQHTRTSVALELLRPFFFSGVSCSLQNLSFPTRD